MDIKNWLSIMAGALAAIGYIPYILAIFGKQIKHFRITILGKPTKPIKASWIIWSSLDWLVLIGMYLKDSMNGQILMMGIGSLVVMLLSFKYGRPGWTRIEKLCLLGVVLGGVMLWFKDPLLGIIIGLVIQGLGSIPTYISSWEDPSRENRSGWTFGFISSIAVILSISSWTLAKALQPVAFLLMGVPMMFILYFRSETLKER